MRNHKFERMSRNRDWLAIQTVADFGMITKPKGTWPVRVNPGSGKT